MRPLLPFFFILIFSPIYAQKVSVQFTSLEGKKKIASLRTYKQPQGDLLSLHDFCNTFNIDLLTSYKQVALRYLDTEVHFMLHSSFATVLDTSKKKKFVYQFYERPILNGKMVFIHPREVKRMFASIFEGDCSYEKDLNLLKISFSSRKNKSKDMTDFPLCKIVDYNVIEKANGVVINFFFVGPKPKFEYLSGNLGKVGYLTILKSINDLKDLQKSFKKESPVISIKAFTLKKNTTQFTIVFNTVFYKIISSEATQVGSHCVRILARFQADVQKILETEQEKQRKQKLDYDKEKWKLDVITLDAGHGGHDPGAIGINGTKEKDIALNVVLKVGALLSKYLPEVKVVYTRKDDTFVGLKKRGKIANDYNSKLFVSIHCNASTNKNAKGVEVYLLGLHKTDDALAVAEKENAVILSEPDYKINYKDFTEENLITITLAQSAFLKQSNTLAELTCSSIQKSTHLNGRGVKQAGFMVLWTPSMPSILVEIGFISNEEEEAYLTTNEAQNAISKAVYEAITRYKIRYENF